MNLRRINTEHISWQRRGFPTDPWLMQHTHFGQLRWSPGLKEDGHTRVKKLCRLRAELLYLR